MLQLKNYTPFATQYFVLPNEQAIDSLYVNVKASFNIGESWTLCDEQSPPLSEDIYWGEPGKSSLKYPSDIHQGKPSTDIAVHGSAWAPHGKPIRQLDVSVAVGTHKNTLRVFGDRVWQHGRISAAKEFIHMPLFYEHSYGGQHWLNSQLISLAEKNPVGKGYKGTRKADEMEGRPLPNIENSQQLIGSIDDNPSPAGFGFIAANWHPRALHAGTYDEQWQCNRAPYLPHDYQPIFQNSAHPELISRDYLVGGEAVTITNMHPDGPLHFLLPHINLSGDVIAKGLPQQTLDFVMETLCIDVDEGILTMVWKASSICNNNFARISAINVRMLR